jgi:hypothetical protein
MSIDLSWLKKIKIRVTLKEGNIRVIVIDF